MNITTNFSVPFIRRPVTTTLLVVGIMLAGIIGFRLLPTAPLPQIDFPTIVVQANLPGASAETMASSVATPLERQLGRIAGVTEMTSSSSLSSANITLQFDLNRDINAAERDVQASINAARAQLPANMPAQPRFRKVNPADAPILLLSLTSDERTMQDMYDVADSELAQKLSQVEGIGQVFVGGSSQPAVRVEADPRKLDSYGISLVQVAAALNQANAHSAVGAVSRGAQRWQLRTTDQIFHAYEYKPLIVAQRNGLPVHLQDVADVHDSVTDIRNLGLISGRRAIILVLFRQPGANIVSTVDRVRALLPTLQASIPPAMKLGVVSDRTPPIRSSIREVELTLLIAIVLVVLVVFAFLRNAWATLIPSIAVPVSLLGTFAVMYLLDYSLDNLSLMALTISTGFVVDDAIVVIENIARHMEAGMKPFAATIQGAREIGFTVLSMSTSLVAVFIPILLMGGIVGRLFREFAVTLSVAIGMSLLVSLTATPMMCARFLRHDDGRHGVLYHLFERGFLLLAAGYRHALGWVLRHQPLILTFTVLTLCVNLYMFVLVPKGFFPQQDTGRIVGSLVADQDVSFDAMVDKMQALVAIVKRDPAVRTISAFTSGNNSARMFIELKPLSERPGATADTVINRLRRQLNSIPGANLFLQSVQDVRIGGFASNAQFQYSLQADRLSDLETWAPRLLQRLQQLPEIRDANSNQQTHGLETMLTVDRDTAARLGVPMQAVDQTLGDAFGQAQVSNMYEGINQYHVVLEVAPQYQRDPAALNLIYVANNGGKLIPLSAFAHYTQSSHSLSVNHQGHFPAITLSFNLAPGVPMDAAVNAIQNAERDIGMPASVHGGFMGTAEAFKQSLSTEKVLIITALGAVFIVLGVLYESYIHPITILSTLPSAGIGALLAIFLFKSDLNVMAMIGIVLLIGIVKKNAILMIDFAIHQERECGKPPIEAIYDACLMRFRPIMMTTMAAMLGALPLALATGSGSELRRPLGITIVGGLIVSQMLTLFTTPVVYLYMDRLQLWIRSWHLPRRAPQPALE